MSKFIFILLCLIPLAWSTRVNANYFTMKSFLLYFVGGLSFLYAFFQKKSLNIPAGLWKWAALFFVGLHLIYAVAVDFPTGLFYVPKFLSLVGIIFFLAYTNFNLEFFLKKYEWLVAFFFGVLFILTSRGYVNQFDSNLPFQAADIIYPFGNVNMLAEFYVLCIPLVYFWIKQKNEISNLVKWIIFILIQAIVISTQSRSALLGIVLWWCFFILSSDRKQLKILLGLSIFILLGAGLFISQKKTDLFAFKNLSSSIRLNFYRSALDLIQDRPLGVGSQYANQIIPYRLHYPYGPQESEYPDQPHSEILKWGVEFGWLGLLSSLIVLGFITWYIARKGSFLLRGASLVILPQLFFQFPFENPATIVLLAVYLYLFSQSLHQKTVPLYKWFKGICLVAGFGLLYFSVVFIVSIYYESNYPDRLDKTSLACRLNPSYLRGCVRKNYNLLQDLQLVELKNSLKEDMHFNYYAADYLKILHDSFSEANQEPELVMQDESMTSISVFDSIGNESVRIKKTCQIVHIYAYIYKQQFYFSDDDIKACQGISAPFQFNITPSEFDREYKSWLAQLLK